MECKYIRGSGNTYTIKTTLYLIRVECKLNIDYKELYKIVGLYI